MLEMEQVLWAVGLRGERARYTFNTFPRTEANGWVVDAAQRWVAANPKPTRGLVLVGPPGIGKSGLAAAVLREAVNLGRQDPVWAKLLELRTALRQPVERGELLHRPVFGWFEDWGELSNRLMFKRDGALMGDLLMLQTLVLDDIDASAPSDTRNALLKRLVDREFPTIVTANHAPDLLASRVGDRVADRLKDFAVLFWQAPSERGRVQY